MRGPQHVRKTANALDKLRTAQADVKCFNHAYQWAVQIYGSDHPRVAQAHAELALAVLSQVELRGRKQGKNAVLGPRPLSFDDLVELARPALNGVYGHTYAELRKEAFLVQRADNADAERAKRRAERKRAKA